MSVKRIRTVERKCIHFKNPYVKIFALHCEEAGKQNVYTVFLDLADGLKVIGREISLKNAKDLVRKNIDEYIKLSCPWLFKSA